MNLKLFLSFLLLIVLGYSCSDEDMSLYAAFPFFEQTQEAFSDDEILDAAYSNYFYPADFYIEDLYGAGLQYENSQSIETEFDSQTKIELCANNIDDAKAWSLASISENHADRYLSNQSETEKYFQFEYRVAEVESDILLSRVHKCSYIDRSVYNKIMDTNSSTIGTFNLSPYSLENIKELVEYLWFIDNVNKKVLSSYVHEYEQEYVHHIYEINIKIGKIGEQDEIDLNKVVYKIKKDTGDIEFNLSQIKTVTGRLR